MVKFVWFLILFFGVSSQAAAELSRMPRWKEVSEVAGVKVWTREVADSEVREFKATGVIDAPAEIVWKVINDTAQFSKFIPYLKEARAIDPLPAPGDPVHFEYQITEAPLISLRDTVLKVTTSVTSTEDETVYVREWEGVDNIGPQPTKDMIRMPLCQGRFVLRRLDGKSTQIVYWMHADPGGNVATWLVNNTAQKILIDILIAVRTRSQHITS
jgi:hypothetical protein